MSRIPADLTPSRYLAALGIDIETRPRELESLPSLDVLRAARALDLPLRRLATLGWAVTAAQTARAGDVLPEVWVTAVCEVDASERALVEALALAGLVLEHPVSATDGVIRDSIVLTAEQMAALDRGTVARVGSAALSHDVVTA